MSLPNDDQVRFDILIEAQASLKALQELLRATDSNQKKIIEFSNVVIEASKRWGVSWQQALAQYKQLNAELSKNKKANIFGNVGGQDMFKGAERYMQSLEQAKRLQTDVGNAATQMGEKTEKATSRMARGIDAVRIALGVLVSMLIFNVIQSIQNTFREAINNLRETELAVYNLINAEKRLSELGVEIDPKGLQEIIDSVRELVPILSQVDAEELVARIATNVAPSLKLTREEIEKLTKAVALAYVQNKALGYSFDEIEKSFTDSVLTGKVSQGINKYGVKIDDLIVKQHAVKMGLVETEEAFDKLSGEAQAHVQAMALIDYAYQEFSKNAESIPEYLETSDAAFEKLNKTWSDFLTTVGVLAGPIIIKFLEILINGLEIAIAALERFMPILQAMVANLAGFIGASRNTGRLAFWTHPDFAANWEAESQRIMDAFKGLAEAADTPTSAVEDLQDALDEFDAEGFGNKIEDILEDAANAREDLAKKFEQKSDDIDTEYARKAADAELDLARKIEDINRDAERDIQKVKEDHRQEDLRAEEDYQNKLWELRMRYLMDLEEALHARDARQVLRLMKQYAIDKEALERKKNLDDEAREENQQNELEDIERRRQERLEDAQIEYEQRLADQQVAKQRELDDLALWYAREQADLEEAIKRKMETLIKGWIDEEKLTEEHAAEVYRILSHYFGPGGLTDSLYQYMMSSLLQAAQFGQQLYQGMAMSTSAPGTPAPATSTGGSAGAGGGARPNQGNNRYAEGGTLIATRPTRALFGEAGPEAVTFTPLNRVGKNQSKVFGSGAGGVNGTIEVAIDLSPDLEARIVDASMDGVANVIAKINRSKV